MQCPKCRTNIYGNLNKCTVCGYIFNNTPLSASTEPSQSQNGILDPTNIDDYAKKLNQNMNGLNNNNKYNKGKSSSSKIMLPIILLLIVVIFVFIIGIIHILAN